MIHQFRTPPPHFSLRVTRHNKQATNSSLTLPSTASCRTTIFHSHSTRGRLYAFKTLSQHEADTGGRRNVPRRSWSIYGSGGGRRIQQPPYGSRCQREGRSRRFFQRFRRFVRRQRCGIKCGESSKYP